MEFEDTIYLAIISDRFYEVALRLILSILSLLELT